jgi:hypothetical protein
MIDKQTNDYYDAMFDMFNSKGWKEFMSDMEFALDALDNLESIQDEKQLFTTQGQVKTLKSIIGFQSAIEATYEDLKNDS